jgi:hypothetical protein
MSVVLVTGRHANPLLNKGFTWRTERVEPPVAWRHLRFSRPLRTKLTAGRLRPRLGLPRAADLSAGVGS